jgi:hypothetical protein
MNYTLDQLSPGIFYIEMENAFDLAMLFLRVQEYCESPYENIKKKNFTLLEYMKAYCKDHDNEFTYARDWAGFNVSGKAIEKLYSKKNYSKIRDINPYDERMSELHEAMCRVNEYKKAIAPKIIDLQDLSIKAIIKHKDSSKNSYLTDEIVNTSKNTRAINRIINKERHNNNYYLIGALKDDTITLKHELCHAFYNLYDEYRIEAFSILRNLPTKAIEKLSYWLADMGYACDVEDDEFQAYLTHDYDDVVTEIKFTKAEQKAVLKASNLLRDNFYKYVKLKK